MKRSAKREQCARYCGGELDGIVANLKLRGLVAPDSEFHFKLLRMFALIPPHSYQIKCALHHNVFLLVDENGKAITESMLDAEL